MSRLSSICTISLAFALYSGDGLHGSDSPPQEISVELPSDTSMEFVWIQPGAFIMGSPEGEPGRLAAEGPQHDVTISKSRMGPHDRPVAPPACRAPTGAGGRFDQLHSIDLGIPLRTQSG